MSDGQSSSATDSVTITVRVPVPDVLGLTQSGAETMISGTGLVVGTVTQEHSNTVPAGNVISQTPEAGTLVLAGTPVSLVVSLGPQMVTVHDVVGLTQSSAETAITGAGLVVGTVTRQYSDTVPAGRVISQSPAAGDSVASGSPVSLVVSLGPQGGPLPPDPGDVAPPVDTTTASTLYETTEFLYTGTDPIQTGVDEGTIDAKRAAVLRGRTLQGNGQPLPGVTITILNHPEYGQTRTRTDGMFDMVANGGEGFTVNYMKDGYLPAQRKIEVPWQDYVWLPDVILIPKDSQVAAIDLTAPVPIQVAQGSVVSDEDGSRQATLLFPEGNTASIVFSDGNTQALTELNVRITEYTVGPNGPKAMPAELPPNVGYTYCVEFSVDQADVPGAKEVRFENPLFHYVHNFLGFPVGMRVPVGYYDRERAAWIPSDNGRVIGILSISSETGLAELDTDGDGSADNGVLLGITSDERATLATLFEAGDSVWRVPITHFSPWDCNWPFGPPVGCCSSPTTTGATQ